jgi:hypothetical protein
VDEDALMWRVSKIFSFIVDGWKEIDKSAALYQGTKSDGVVENEAALSERIEYRARASMRVL